MSTVEPVAEIWVFAGTRVGQGGRRVHAWLPVGTDNELWFKAQGSHSVGSEYTVRVTRHDNGSITKYGTPEYLGRHSDEVVRAKLDTAHRAAETRLRLLALERNDKRHNALDAALEPVCDLIRSASTADRDAILTYVLRRLSRAW
jgi:hypothetical protein